ncbi:MAG: glycosyltransferase family 2 protein [Lachnospiraceae bacterium]|nr:glycosyltransferase family 2 protein [Lachnospiraceae bacterium]
MEKSKVTIIVPVYNIENYLPHSVKSIQQQTYSNLEIILIDDGSSDNSGLLCDQYANSDNRIHVIHKENSGLSDARNTGIDNATGEFLLFIDGDDYIDKEMVQLLLERLQNDHTDLALCDLIKVDETGNITEEPEWKLEDKKLSRKEYWYELYADSSIPYVVACNKLYKKSLFENVRYPKGKLHEDEFVIHKIISQCNNISIVQRTLYYYIQHPGSIMNKPYDRRRLQVLEAFGARTDYFLSLGETKLSWRVVQGMRAILSTAFHGMDMTIAENQKAFKDGQKLHWRYARKCCRQDFLIQHSLKALVFTISPKLYFILVPDKKT